MITQVQELSKKLRNPNARLENLISYIKDRAEDPIHKDHRQAIADFLDTFVISELKGCEKSDPSQVQSYQKKTVRVPYAGTKVEGSIPNVTPVPAIPKPRNGNGHLSLKKRKLTDNEKDHMRSFFRSKNGIFKEDDLVRFREKNLDPEVSIFQVTGFMTLVHKDIAAGRFSVPNMGAYLEWMRGQRRLYARYNSPKYQRLRDQNKTCLAGII